ncbi:MAG TPA: helix-turn-helix domain-containing protein [Kofleriaceae bacterium]|nr:helix-turn-helix domain-containing protein [Kofleriaceae bacterium]
MADAARKLDLVVTLSVEQLRALIREEVDGVIARQRPKGKEVLGFGEVCELLDASAPTVRRWIQKDNLPYIKLGGRSGGKILKFRRSEVLAWLDGRRP